MTYYDIIKKLIGPVSSVGETNEDAARLKNLEDTIELVDRLVSDISDASNSDGAPEASRAKIGKLAKEFLNDLLDSLT